MLFAVEELVWNSNCDGFAERSGHPLLNGRPPVRVLIEDVDVVLADGVRLQATHGQEATLNLHIAHAASVIWQLALLSRSPGQVGQGEKVGVVAISDQNLCKSHYPKSNYVIM